MTAFTIIKSGLQISLYFALGAISLILSFVYIIFNIPIYIYRMLVTKLIAPYCCPKIGKPISLCGQGCATDFMPNNIQYSSRSAIVYTSIFKGHLSLAELYDTIEHRLINTRDQLGTILYPEMKQYIHNFMGFMFWRQDEYFQLRDHIKEHDIGVTATDESSETFIFNLVESLFNKSFTLKKSPWEFHLLQNYRNGSLCDDPMSVVILRVHHLFGDGPSMLTWLGRLLYEENVENLNIAVPRQTKVNIYNSKQNVVSTVLRTVYDVGYLTRIFFQKTPWLVPNSKKTHRQFLARTKIISTRTIKRIKDKFGVRFSAVVLSCISAAVSKRMNRDQQQLSLQRKAIPLAVPIPIWNPSKTLGIFSTGIFLDLPIGFNMDSVERLRKCNHLFDSSIHSTQPALVTILLRILNANLASVTRYLCSNIIPAIYLTSFPPPENIGRFGGRNLLLRTDYCTGNQLGNAGMGFVLSGSKEQARIIVTCEAAIMDKANLNLLIADVETELQLLDELNYDIS